MKYNSSILAIRDKKRTEEELQKEHKELEMRLIAVKGKLLELKDAQPFDKLEIPFNKLSIEEKSVIFEMGEPIFNWFATITRNEYGMEHTNSGKSIQDYIDEGEPAGHIRFFTKS